MWDRTLGDHGMALQSFLIGETYMLEGGGLAIGGMRIPREYFEKTDNNESLLQE